MSTQATRYTAIAAAALALGLGAQAQAGRISIGGSISIGGVLGSGGWHVGIAAPPVLVHPAPVVVVPPPVVVRPARVVCAPVPPVVHVPVTRVVYVSPPPVASGPPPWAHAHGRSACGCRVPCGPVRGRPACTPAATVCNGVVTTWPTQGRDHCR